jgi:hypothetical protein
MEIKSIISLVMSGLFGIYKIFNSAKNQSSTELSLIDRNWIPLITSNLSELSHIKIEHNLPFDSNQYYYRGTIINSGTIDIHNGLILKPLKIAFEKDCEILNFTITESENEIELIINATDKDVSISWDLLKPLEKFSFEMSIESKENLKIYKFNEMFKITSRIAGIEKIKMNSFLSLKDSGKQFIRESLPTYFFISFLYALFIYIIFIGVESYTNPSPKLSYTIVTKNKHEEVRDIKYFDTKSVELELTSRNAIIPKSEINQLEIQVITKTPKKRIWNILIGILMIGLTSVRTVSLIREDIHNFKLKRVYKALF